MNNARVKPLVLRDEIHGDMVFDDLMRAVVDHPYFQRLRYVKQLGLAEYVFPCATHTRFQHSLGAGHLASEYFECLLQAWSNSSFDFENEAYGTRFYSEATRACVNEVAGHLESREFWKRVVVLGALLHDVGHGPWSHTFEVLKLRQNYSDSINKLGDGPLRGYFDELLDRGEPLSHEDVSILYVSEILSDLAMRHASPLILAVATLINRRLMLGNFRNELEGVLERGLDGIGMRGSVNFHRLLRPIVSGPFDVDRMDYIQRDGRNCGVEIAGIEWQRIMSKLLPCLAHHPNGVKEPDDVVLVSHVKNQHVLDDFIFTLFQMYTQVYLHPKIVGFEELIRELCMSRLTEQSPFTITLDVHRSLSDDKFRTLLEEKFALPEINAITARAARARFDVTSCPDGSGMEEQLGQSGFRAITNPDRPMMKDSVGVYLYSSLRDMKIQRGSVRPWSEISPIARHFYSINYAPQIWLRAGEV